MADIIELPNNLITPHDQEALEAFGGHEIARGRATRFDWTKSGGGDPVFNIYRGGADEKLALSIYRNRTEDLYEVIGEDEKNIVTGSLDHVMAVLDKLLACQHGESDNDDTPA